MVEPAGAGVWRRAALDSRAGRRGLALAFALMVNGLLATLILLAQPAFHPAPIPAVELVLVRSRPPATPPKPSVTRAPRPPSAAWMLNRHAPPAPTATATLTTPAVTPEGPAASSSLGPITLSKSPWLDDCTGADLDRLPAAKRDRCVASMLKYRPAPQGGPTLALKDPHGEFAKAAAENAYRRAPMLQAPIHTCRGDQPGSNFGVGCSN